MKNPLRNPDFRLPAIFSLTLRTRTRGLCAFLLVLVALIIARPSGAAEFMAARIRFAELGAKVASDYHDGAIGIEASDEGARMRTDFGGRFHGRDR
jgi:hypothetical protein